MVENIITISTTSVRSERQYVIDNLLLLHLIKKCNSVGNITGITKLEKLVFLAKYVMVQNQIKDFNYRFFKWNYGSYSRGLHNDFSELLGSNLIKEDGGIKLTERGEKLLEICNNFLQHNEGILKIIEKIAVNYSEKSLSEIKKIIYNIEIIKDGKLFKISDMPKDEAFELLSEMVDTELKNSFIIPEEWIETLEMEFNEDSSNAIEEFRKDITEGRIRHVGSISNL